MANEYTTLYTLRWAAIYDPDYMANESQIKGSSLLDQLQENDLHVSYYGQELYIPDRVPNEKVDVPVESYDGRYDYH